MLEKRDFKECSGWKLFDYLSYSSTDKQLVAEKKITKILKKKEKKGKVNRIESHRI